MPALPLTIAVNRSLNRLAGMKRGDVCKLAADLADVPWVQESFWHAHDRDISVLGRFDLIGPDRITPWPSVIVKVRRRPRHSGQADRCALVAVYLNGDGAWECEVRESGNPPWSQWRGNQEGEPSVLNGDDPRAAEIPAEPVPQP